MPTPKHALSYVRACRRTGKNRRIRPIGWPKKWRPEKGDSSIGRILENTAWLLGGQGVGALLSFVYLAIITRTLGPAGFGPFALILTTAQVISIIVSFESWQVIVKFGQELVHNSDTDRFGRFFGFCIAIHRQNVV